jgi:hypothetical protein
LAGDIEFQDFKREPQLDRGVTSRKNMQGLAMKKNTVCAVEKEADSQFLHRMGAALLLLTFTAGAITVFGATTSPYVDLDLWPIWQLTGDRGGPW